MPRRRTSTLTGAALLLAAVVLALLPFEADGVSGNALRPQYGSFGWFAYAPLDAEATPDELRAAGVDLPHDAVARRRATVAVVGLAGVVLLGVGTLRRRSGPPRLGP